MGSLRPEKGKHMSCWKMCSHSYFQALAFPGGDLGSVKAFKSWHWGSRHRLWNKPAMSLGNSRVYRTPTCKQYRHRRMCSCTYTIRIQFWKEHSLVQELLEAREHNRRVGFGERQAWVRIPALPLTSIRLANSLNSASPSVHVHKTEKNTTSSLQGWTDELG